jgi:predicted dehydrogenase
MRILINGLGSIGRKHVNAIRAVYPDAEIYAMRSGTATDCFQGVINLSEPCELTSYNFDFAIISNPTSEHKKSIHHLLPLNIPLFIEKPLYHSLDIKDTVGHVLSKKIFTYIACNLRFLECIRFLKENISGIMAKRINEINVYCGSYLPEWRPNADFRKTYSAHEELGGGIHLDMIHEIDYLYWLFGLPEKVYRKFKRSSSLSISSIDYANYLLDYGNFCANVVLNYYRRDTRRFVEIVFEDETWYADLTVNKITCGDKVIFSSDQLMADTYIRQIQYFVEHIERKEETFNTITDAFNVLKIGLGDDDFKR